MPNYGYRATLRSGPVASPTYHYPAIRQGELAPHVIEAYARDATHVAVVFSSRMRLAELLTVANWTIAPSGGAASSAVTAVTSESSGEIAVLTCGTLTPAGSYTVTCSAALVSIFGVLIDPLDRSDAFTGPVAVVPLSIAAVSTDSTHLRVTFSVPVLTTRLLSLVTTFATSPVLTIKGATPAAGATPLYVDLETSEQTQGTVYSVVVENIEKAA